ncbi:MAG: deoxyhypusine synthase [Candidatus Woesearchaeota archaeon]
MDNNLQKGKENVLRESEEPQGPEIHGYNFDKGVDYDKLLDSFATTGFQASHLARAIEIINKMREEKCTIYLGYTSNLVTSGLRDIFRYLVQNKMVDILVTTAGGIEEDIIKCIKPFILGRFDADGKELREKGINRAGNIYIPNSRYCRFEDFLVPILEKLALEQKETGQILTPSELVWRLGKEINNPESIYYWAQKNNIPVYCPAITDGSIGDMLYFFSFKHPEFKLDIARDMKKYNDFTLNAKKTGLIILGASLIKHSILNANMLRNGCNYAVYINNSQEFDGSDAGARPEEAVSWGKIAPEARSIKVFGDATILFPLIVAKTFAKK